MISGVTTPSEKVYVAQKTLKKILFAISYYGAAVTSAAADPTDAAKEEKVIYINTNKENSVNDENDR